MGAILQNPDINNLVFLHIPKCAGSTFLFILNHQYKKLKRFDVKQLSPNTSNESLLSELGEEKRKNIHLIRGHVLFKIHKHLIGPTKYITFLRHPVSRVVSLYHFMKSTPQNRLYPVIHKNNMSIKDFVLYIDDADINNTQIKRIGGGPLLEESEQLEKALKNIDEFFPVVGLVEQYDESLMLLKNYYNWSWPFYATVNKNKSKPKASVSEEVKEIILEKNQGDLQLYNVMKERLNEQIHSSAINIEQQVKKFQSLNKYFFHHYLITAYSKLM